MRVHVLMLRRRWPVVVLVGCAALAATAPAFIAIDALITARLHDGLFPAATRLYARPTVLYPRAIVDRDRLERGLHRLGYRRARRGEVEVGAYRLGFGTWVIGRRAFRHADLVEPAGIVTVRVGSRDRVREIRDPDGQLLTRLVLDPELLGSVSAGRSVHDRTPVRLSDVPDDLVAAVLAVEDRRFFEHQGLDPIRIAGAALANVRAGRVVQGASTITQQLVKNLFLSPRRTPLRKLREMAMAVVLELRHGKEEILEAYLNHVYLGQDRGLAIHGVGRAAQHYFGKDVGQLDLGEAALLAGLISAPNAYTPLRHPELAAERRALVLRLMRESGLITDAEYQKALGTPLALTSWPEGTDGARYFVDFVTEQLAQTYGRDLRDAGLAVFTTLDMELQQIGEDAVRRGIARLEAEHPRLTSGEEPLQAALVAIDPRSGELLAMIGGRDYAGTQFNRAAHAQRQPGSAFKPVVALAALTRGRGYTLATRLEDRPLTVQTTAGSWEPANYDRRFRGPVTLREALERSLNVPFARLGMEVGLDAVVATARDLGFTSPLHPVPSLALGSSEVTPLEMARAFGVLAAGGYRADLAVVLGVLGPRGAVMSRFQPEGRQVFEAAHAYVVTSALQGVVERGTGRSLRRLGYRGPVAAKSGTTNDYRDAWFIGYTPSLAVSVWVGFDEGRSLGLPGSQAALPIVARFLADAQGTNGGRDFDVPSGIEIVEVEPETGLRAGPGCHGALEVFVRGTAPVASCSPSWRWRDGVRRSGSGWRTWGERLVERLRRRSRRRKR